MAQPNYIRLARQIAIRAKIDPNAFVRQINTESNFRPNVTSPAGAQGIAQIMPSTARAWGVNPNDPVAALKAAAAHMAAYQRQTGSLKGALEMYNLGHTAPDAQLPAETRNYIAKITAGGGGAPVTAPRGASQVLRPAQAAVSPGVDRSQIALSLLGFGGSSNDPLDPLTLAMQAAQNGAYATSPRSAVVQASPATSVTPKTSLAGAVHVDGKPVSGWIASILEQARKTGLWKGQVTSGIRSYADQQKLYQNYLHGGNIAAKPGQSNHESGNAVDVSDPQGLNAALQKLGITKLKWAVSHGLADEPHFSNTGR